MLRRWKAIIEVCAMRDRVVIFGMGGWYQNNKLWLHKYYDVIAFSDNDSQRQGKCFEGLRVLAPTELVAISCDFILIASMYVAEIRQQLEALSIAPERILSKDDLPQREQQLAYLFNPKGPCETTREALSTSEGRAPRRALICASGLGHSGVERALSVILKNLKLPDYHIDLLLLGDRQSLFLQALPETVQRHYLFANEQQIVDGLDAIKLGEASVLAAAILPDNYDLYVAYNEGYPTKLIAGVVPRRLARKVAWVHLDLFAWHSSSYAYTSQMQEQTAYLAFDQLIFVSRSVEQGFYKRFTALPLRSGCVIHNPFPPAKMPAASMPRPFAGFTCISIGRFTGQKRFDLLLLALYRLSSENLPFNLILLGEGEKYSTLAAQVMTMGLSKYVLMPGFVHDSEAWLQSADLYVSASVAEGYPMVLGEALLHGLPVLASDCSGNKDILADGRFGQLFVSGCLEALIAALRALIVDANALAALRKKAALAQQSEQFDLARIMKEITARLLHE
ncbi:glycosyltransferase [Aeromonas diversa]|uniref:glycosyltransferase n=1 Tax=Aeromonas diversa TaxID=502790 RepID=UPI0039A15560